MGKLAKWLAVVLVAFAALFASGCDSGGGCNDGFDCCDGGD